MLGCNGPEEKLPDLRGQLGPVPKEWLPARAAPKKKPPAPEEPRPYQLPLFGGPTAPVPEDDDL